MSVYPGYCKKHRQKIDVNDGCPDCAEIPTQESPPRTYLGDAVYAEFDGHRIILTCEDGIQTYEKIVLEPEVFAALIDFAKRTKDEEVLR